MFRIGEFASLTGISIHMLRNYDKIGLLIPNETDNNNSYRYYTENQIIAANRIQILKELGFGLKEIHKINNSSDEEIQQLIENKIVEIQHAAQHLEKQIQRMRQTVSDLDADSDFVFSVRITALAARKVVSLRAKISKFEEEGLLWEQLDHECAANNIKTLRDAYAFAVTHSFDLKNRVIDTEVQRIIEEIPQKKSKLKVCELPAAEVAAVTFKGVYSRISDISCYVHNYIKDMNFEICGPPLRRYFKSPRNECDPQEYITEYYFILKKI